MYQPYFDKFIGMEPYLEIDEAEMTYIKETFSKEDVCESLATVTMNHYGLPYADITIDDARRDFNKLKGVWWPDLLVEGEWLARNLYDNNDLTYNGKSLYFKRSNEGNRASNYFHQENRWKVWHNSHKGPQTTWESMRSMKSLFGALYTLDIPKLDKAVLRSMIALRKYIASQFRPSVAKALYERFDAKVVLDFSAGWGDRLAGFYACSDTETYIGIDPNTPNHIQYQAQADAYATWQTMLETKKEVHLYPVPAEDWDNSEWIGKVDIVFTSPPYFDVERYSEDDTQSWVRYNNIDAWNKSFLHKALDNVWETLKIGGHAIINISDVYKRNRDSEEKLQFDEICRPMIEYMTSKPDCVYEGVIGMEMASRPNNNSIEHAKDSVFGEPMWIFKKVESE